MRQKVLAKDGTRASADSGRANHPGAGTMFRNHSLAPRRTQFFPSQAPPKPAGAAVASAEERQPPAPLPLPRTYTHEWADGHERSLRTHQLVPCLCQAPAAGRAPTTAPPAQLRAVGAAPCSASRPLPSLFPCQQLQPAPPFLTLKENYFCGRAWLDLLQIFPETLSFPLAVPRQPVGALPSGTSRGRRWRPFPSAARLRVLIPEHRHSLWYLPRHPPSPAGRLLTLPANQSLRPTVFTPAPTTAVRVAAA